MLITCSLNILNLSILRGKRYAYGRHKKLVHSRASLLKHRLNQPLSSHVGFWGASSLVVVVLIQHTITKHKLLLGAINIASRQQIASRTHTASHLCSLVAWSIYMSISDFFFYFFFLLT